LSFYLPALAVRLGQTIAVYDLLTAINNDREARAGINGIGEPAWPEISLMTRSLYRSENRFSESTFLLSSLIGHDGMNKHCFAF